MTQITVEKPEQDPLSQPLVTTLNLDWEKVTYIVFIVLAIVTRFWSLGDRVMSHDESLHTQFSFQFYDGQGYSHTPLMHGPFLFHITAVSYWLFGDSDFSARIPVALFGVLLVALPYLLRDWLGRVGALFTSFIFLISPYVTYYSRYIRHDIYVIMWALIVFISIWRYMEDREEKYLWWFAAGNALMFATKEVSFIYVAIFGSFLIVRLLVKMFLTEWLPLALPRLRPALGILILGILMMGIGGLTPRLLDRSVEPETAETVTTEGFAADPNEDITATTTTSNMAESQFFPWLLIIGIGILSLALFMIAQQLRPDIDQFPEFDLIVLFTTLILPTVAALLPFLLGWNPRDYSLNTCVLQGQESMNAISVLFGRLVSGECWQAFLSSGLTRTGSFLVLTLVVSVLVGVWWHNRRWLISAVIFHSIFAILYTSVFTNPGGWASGMIGSLAYWLEQQEVQRGSQPTFYYLFVVSFYEFLPLIFSMAAIRYWLRKQRLDKIIGYWVWTILVSLLIYSLINWQYNRPPLADGQEVSVVPGIILGGVYFVLRGLYWFIVLRQQLVKEYEVQRRLWHLVDLRAWVGFIPALIWWLLLTWIAYTVAGEKMPWLSVHFVIPMAFLCGWYLNEKLKGISYQTLLSRQGWALLGITTIWIVAVALAIAPLLLGQIEFGNQQTQNLAGIGRFLGSVVAVVGLYFLWQYVNEQADEEIRITPLYILRGVLLVALVTLVFLLLEPLLQGQTALRSVSGIIRLVLIVAAVGSYLFFRSQNQPERGASPVLVLSLFAILSLLTIRFTYLANFPNADYTTEYMVYAHGAPATKDTVMQQVEELSMRMHGDKSIRVAFDSDVSWPFTWYLRDYPNRNFFGENPSNNLNESPIVIVGRKNWDKTDPYLGDNYERREYTFLWWPMEEYRHISWTAILGNPNGVERRGLGDPRVRQAVWDIFFYRDYEQFGQVFGGNYTAGEWPLRHDLRLYVRKDVLANLWDYGIGAVNAEGLEDPYAEGELAPQPIMVLNESGVAGAGQGQFTAPHNVAIGPDGRIYVADSGNHRIQVFDADGSFLTMWGSFGAEPGLFNEPWGLTVDNNFVYVADTWNHRVQVFSHEGQLIANYGQSGSPVGEEEGLGLFFGPRDVLLIADDGLLVTDTGNHRIQIMDRLGNYLSQLGGLGGVLGQLNEPVGLGRGPDGSIFIADTWNGRIQRFDPNLIPAAEWRVSAWYGQSITNKPYVAVDSANRVYVTDPEGYRVLIFSSTGDYIGRFGQFGDSINNFALPNGIAIDAEDNLYIADANNNRILKFAPLFRDASSVNDLLSESEDRFDNEVELDASGNQTDTVPLEEEVPD